MTGEMAVVNVTIKLPRKRSARAGSTDRKAMKEDDGKTRTRPLALIYDYELSRLLSTLLTDHYREAERDG